MNDRSRSKPAAGIQIRIIHLLVLSAFTAAQPIYDLLTRHPEFLPAHQSEGVDILLLTLALSLLLPGAAALVVRGLARVHPQLGAGIYLGLLGLLTAGLALQGLRKLPASRRGRIGPVAAFRGRFPVCVLPVFGDPDLSLLPDPGSDPVSPPLPRGFGDPEADPSRPGFRGDDSDRRQVRPSSW